VRENTRRSPLPLPLLPFPPLSQAGIVSSLSARTSVIAAANPCGGHYDRGKTIVENLRVRGRQKD
jgi:hypothetical protein